MADIRRLPTPVAEVWDWQLHGACRGESTSLFFHPDGERGPARARRQNAAKAVCSRCPVIDACLKHALSAKAKASSIIVVTRLPMRNMAPIETMPPVRKNCEARDREFQRLSQCICGLSTEYSTNMAPV